MKSIPVYLQHHYCMSINGSLLIIIQFFYYIYIRTGVHTIAISCAVSPGPAMKQDRYTLIEQSSINIASVKIHHDGMAPLSPQLHTFAISHCLFMGNTIPPWLSGQLW